MEIIFNDQDFDGLLEEEFIKEFENDIKRFDKNAKWESSDIGRGADWPVILTVYGAILTTITAIPVLLDFVEKFKNHFLYMNKKYGRLKICEDCAKALAISYIGNKENKIKKIKTVFIKNIPVNPPIRENKLGNLSDNPDCYYFFIYHVLLDDKNKFGEFSESYYNFIIKSDGKFELRHKLKIPMWYKF